MTREEAVARIKDHIEIHKYHEWNAVKIFEALDMAIKALQQPESKWIPCSETNDIPDYEVLCCDKNGEELIGWLSYFNDQWLCESNEELMYNPIAWCEKPEPYIEGRVDEIN